MPKTGILKFSLVQYIIHVNIEKKYKRYSNISLYFVIAYTCRKITKLAENKYHKYLKKGNVQVNLNHDPQLAQKTFLV